MNTFVLMVAVLLCLPGAAIARTTLTANDFQLLGGFILPGTVDGNKETAYGHGLALRRINGEVRLLSTAYYDYNYYLYEFTAPTLRTTKPWNTASVQRYWGNVFAHKDGLVNGLYWDETDKRLYYQTSGDYVAAGDTDLPTLAFVTFNQDETTATSYGKWGFSSRGFKKANFGITAVPSDFSTQYLNGKRLAAGFGGYQSVMSHGDVSLGPALTAFNPPAIGTEGSHLANTPMVGYGGAHEAWTTGARPTNTRAWRDDDVISDIYGNISDPDGSTAVQAYPDPWHFSGDESFYWQGYSITGSSRSHIPNNITFDNSRIVTKHWEPGNAFWNNDFLHQAGAWIQTANKEGIVFLPTFSTGHTWYADKETKQHHQGYSDGFEHKWYIYSRDQFASVVQGTVGQNEIQAARYDTDLSTLGISSQFVSGLPRGLCTGMAFDPTDNKLYVMIQYGSNAPVDDMYSTGLIAVYQVNDTAPGFSGKLPPGNAKTVSGSGRFVQ